MRRTKGAINNPDSSIKASQAFRRVVFFLPGASRFSPSEQSPFHRAPPPVGWAFAGSTPSRAISALYDRHDSEHRNGCESLSQRADRSKARWQTRPAWPLSATVSPTGFFPYPTVSAAGRARVWPAMLRFRGGEKRRSIVSRCDDRHPVSRPPHKANYLSATV